MGGTYLVLDVVDTGKILIFLREAVYLWIYFFLESICLLMLFFKAFCFCRLSLYKCYGCVSLMTKL